MYESPYGVRGMAGNMVCWCADVYRPEGPAPAGQQMLSTEDQLTFRSYRGGGWLSIGSNLRVSSRNGYAPSERNHMMGLRLARDAR